MASQPWILSRFVYNSVGDAKLQWSHGLPAMDTVQENREMTTEEKLQWSHGLPAMDTGRAEEQLEAAIELQWSHGLPAMDTSFRRGYKQCRDQASMEPWPPSHGYTGSP